MPLKIY